MTDEAEAGNAAQGPTTAPRRRGRIGLSVASVALVLVIVVANFTVTDDAWPLAPLRMFSYGNKPDGQVHRMRFRADWGSGPVRLHADDFGLRRSELEEQTPWFKQVPADKMQMFVDNWNERHPERRLDHLQVEVVTIQLRDSRRVGEEKLTVIGDWAAEDFTGDRAEIDLPMGPLTWEGHSK